MRGTSYTKSDSYFVGIRVKKNEQVTMTKIDLAHAVRAYFKTFLEEWVGKQKIIEGVTKFRFAEEVAAKNVDFQIRYCTRETLPEEVRPKEGQREEVLLGKRRERDEVQGAVEREAKEGLK